MLLGGAASWQAPQTGKLTDLTCWWATFNDATLDSFLEATQKDNPTLAKAAAAIDKARANRASIDAGFLAQVNASAAAGRSGSLKNSTDTSRTANGGLDSSWEIASLPRLPPPVTILAALPLSLGGALLALIVTRNDFSMPTVIGLLMLMGVVTKNSILLVDTRSWRDASMACCASMRWPMPATSAPAPYS